MADAYGMTNPAPQDAASSQATDRITFHGTPHNMGVGVTLLLAGAAAFVMGMTDVFFAEAMAWTFVIWGALFLFGDLIDYTSTWTVTPEALEIKSALRFWTPRKVWDWPNFNRMDVLVTRDETRAQDMRMHVYFTPPGDSALEREDRQFSPQLARLILEHTGLKPTSPANPSNLEEIAPQKAQYIWNRSGKFVAAS